jgi:hypothetical protein
MSGYVVVAAWSQALHPDQRHQRVYGPYRTKKEAERQRRDLSYQWQWQRDLQVSVHAVLPAPVKVSA